MSKKKTESSRPNTRQSQNNADKVAFSRLPEWRRTPQSHHTCAKRLDYILCSKYLQPVRASHDAKPVDVLPGFTDHAAVMATVYVPPSNAIPLTPPSQQLHAMPMEPQIFGKEEERQGHVKSAEAHSNQTVIQQHKQPHTALPRLPKA